MNFKKLIFRTNKAQSADRLMIQCTTVINREAVTRETIDGIEHIIVKSSTLPDNIVMNGILYPANEIAKGFETLELTHAPIEHPVDSNGHFMSAGDPRAIPNFYAGAYNANVRRENGRVHIDKHINVSEAIKTDRGKRLLDRIEELETNDNPRPIHTSVGVFITVDETDGVQTNADGDEYTLIASDMVFDHDAILLDSVGAAQPHQGVGVAVNKEGKELRVNTFMLDSGDKPTKISRLAALAGNAEHQSVTQMEQSVIDALERSAIDVHWIEELFPDEGRVVFFSHDQLFEVFFLIDSEGFASITGIPLPVERTVTFTPQTNHSEGDAMKEMILNALKKAKIETEGLSEDELFAAYNQLQASQSQGDDDDNDANDDAGIAEVVANAVTKANKPLIDKIADLEVKVNSADEAELTNLAAFVANSGKYAGLDAEKAKLLGVDTLKEMAATCQPAYGLSPVMNSSQGADESQLAPVDMPK